ncbi:MAG: YebC/PmpR family DNA-binding transcriptional regulator [Candidatus Pacebacteria bacterium]|nr:YebC/PmpR family DNA-binding transcriptional regulator [Candidatus Paceibacterota bacterium]
MSGHSHWATIRHQKAIVDKKRGKTFSKLSQMISVAVKEKGKDPQTNSNLRMAIEKARSFNMPKDKIENAIKRGSRELQETNLEKIIFEIYGPGNSAIIIECLSDNKNRTLGEIKQVLSQVDAKLANTGSVQWLFQRKGVIVLSPYKLDDLKQEDKETLELKIIESGAENLKWREDTLKVYTKVEELEKVKNILKNQGLKIKSTSLDWIAKEEIDLPEKNQGKFKKLFELLNELESVQVIYSNINL